MSWLNSLFARDKNRDEPEHSAPHATFAERMLIELDALAVAARLASSVVSTEVFSLLRSTDDTLRPLLSGVALLAMTVEREVAIESLITDYVPTSLRLFLDLPDSERADGGSADRLLTEQVAALERSAGLLSRGIHEDSLSALRTQSLFIQSKFTR